MEDMIRLKINLVKESTRKPIADKGYKIHFWDHDIVKDDYLGSTVPDEQGNAVLKLKRADFRSLDSPFEKKPDIYFTVEKDHSLIYKSPVLENINIDEAYDYNDFTEFCYDLGIFTVNT